MPKLTQKLTVQKVKALSAPGKYGDGDNLWLIIGSTGRKRWEYRYTVAGRSYEHGLGAEGVLSLHEARAKVQALRREVHGGGNPVEARRKRAPKPRATTFDQIAEDCIAAQRQAWTNAKSEAQWRSSLANYASPVIGSKDVGEITTADVYALLEPIWATKPETAKRVRERVEKVLDRATALKLRSGDNPARLRGNLDHLLPQRAKVQDVRHHPALPYVELSAFIATLRKREGVAARALEFTILTAARTSEAVNAKWTEIDLDKGVWTVPKERMKMRREHRVPLSAAAVRLLKALPREDGNDHVFIGSKGKPLSNMAMLKMLERMKRTDLTVHGFRSSFRDWASETTGYPDAVVEMALAHSISSAVEAAYRRGDLFDKRSRLMADWATFCESPAPATGNVVALRA